MTEIIITGELETVPLTEFWNRWETAVRAASYRGVPIIEVDDNSFPSEEESREVNERSARAWKEAVESLAQEKAEVIALLRGMATLETNETMERAVSLIEQASYD